MPKPSELYLGIVELFAVLIPGMYLTGMLIYFNVAGVLGLEIDLPKPLLASQPAQWIAFTITAYTLGTMAFLIAAVLDSLYDWFRKIRWPLDPAFEAATALRDQVLGAVSVRHTPQSQTWWINMLRWFGKHHAHDPMSTISWAKSALLLYRAEAYADVQRYEAESKFFRTMIAVLLTLILCLGLARDWKAIPLVLVAGVLCFFRYAERRHKSTEWACRYVIALYAARRPPAYQP